MKIKGCKGINIVQNIKIQALPGKLMVGVTVFICFWRVVKVANCEDCIDVPGAEAICIRHRFKQN